MVMNKLSWSLEDFYVLLLKTGPIGEDPVEAALVAAGFDMTRPMLRTRDAERLTITFQQERSDEGGDQ